MDNPEHWLRLCAIDGLGGDSQRKLLKAFGLPEQVFAASRSNLRAVIGERADLLFQAPDSTRIEAAQKWLAEPTHQLITLADPRYPRALLDIPDPPTLLFVRGKVELLQQPALAIVGSRHATPSGRDTARAFAEALGKQGYCIVSGLASGIDAAAHEGAIGTVGRSLAVIGTGPDRLYPASNRKLATQLLAEGCIVSEFYPGTPALPANFPRRNRIIAGLSRGVLVVEAALESGSLITSRLALESGREVMAVPGSIHSPLSKGCHRLIKQGAKLVECAEDILEEIGQIHPVQQAETTRLAEALPTPLAALLLQIGWEPTPFDVIVEASGLAAGTVLAGLLELEIQSLIHTLPGDRYQRRR